MWWIFTVVAISFSIPTLPLELQGKHVWVYLSLLFIRALKRTAGPLPYCCNYNNSSLFVGDGLTFLKSINTYSLDGTPLPKSINSYSVSKNSYSFSSTGKKKGQISVALIWKKLPRKIFADSFFKSRLFRMSQDVHEDLHASVWLRRHNLQQQVRVGKCE